MLQTDFGARLVKSARLGAGLTQSELARRAQEPQSVVSAYERGRRQPTAVSLARLVEAAGYHLILVRTPPPRPNSAQAARHLSQVLDLAEQLPSNLRSEHLAFPRLPLNTASGSPGPSSSSARQ
ncbi:MAG: helix-turn-helix domain-containing protein [Acidimicrobiales bacterium]